MLGLTVLFGCPMPSTTVRTIDSRPSIAVRGASASADLLLDGINVGKAVDYNGTPKTMMIESGRHRVSIVDNGSVVYDQNIFVESELKTIIVK